MGHFNHDSIYRHRSLQMQSQNPPAPHFHPHPTSSQSPEPEVKDNRSARKLQKADREKLRRGRLNEHFLELGSTLDPYRPKNDKATILADTIQLLKDLTSQVYKLKAEYATLTEEYRELTQEKNDLREEKTSLKSDLENLNNQHQQRLRAAYPWVGLDHSVVMPPTSYPFPMPMPMPIPTGTIPLHPSMQPYPMCGNQNPAVIHNPCSTFVPYINLNTLFDQQVMQHASSLAQPASGSHVSGKQKSNDKSSSKCKNGKSVDSNDVTTELELKMPESTTDQNSSSGPKDSKKSQRKDSSGTEGSSSSMCSSSCRSGQESSSNRVEGRTSDTDLVDGKKFRRFNRKTNKE